ncbi:MAG: OmpA family protein, partial [Bacteroidota bacterium]|nr:OmpA family protein [Bacteroidota bacterium]
MKKIILFISIIIATLILSAQEKENLGSTINSKYRDINPIVSPDGKTLFFVRVNHPSNKYGKADSEDIWYSELQDDETWSKAKLMPPSLNRIKYNSILSVTPDGNVFLIKGAFDYGKLVSKGFSLVYREKGGWSKPEKLDIRFYEDMDMGEYSGAFLSNNGQVLLMYFSENISNNICDIYFSILQKDGKWTKPKSLGKNINGKKTDEVSPFLASDGKTLYFSSNRPGGVGAYDIYMSRRLDDSWKKWSEPKNLGQAINTSAWEAYYSIDAAGKYAYMVSTENSLGLEDIIRIPLEKEAQPDPVVLISGKVIDSKTGKGISAKIFFEELGQEEPVGTARTNPDNGSFKIILPYGKHYSFSANVDGYFPVSENIDLMQVDEYKEILKNLKLVPIEVGHTVRLNNIFFDFGKAELRPESFAELNKVVKLLNENPEME